MAEKMKSINFNTLNLIIWNTKDEHGSLDFAKDCIKNNISFEFMNKTEFQLTIFDKSDYLLKQTILGSEIINENNFL